MARTLPPVFVPGCGSNVSSWLGAPSIQSKITDLGRVFVPLASAARANGSAKGARNAAPALAFNNDRRLK
jgi:hypothetical protein